ncbi:Uncharacterised protein [Neisseria dentiae]|uniref:hypothetical protein n=1 Tax=Neisseria dentiae TaxID=194197 RepID=UPI000E071C82|nr:hypothetical protein [Neisseria dentiae]STZ83150.1 Uncharacterised protein [Neisseria dentiae]
MFIQDGTFRLTLDDEHTDWTNHRNSDYYRYTAVRIENKSQASQPWKNQPDNVSIIIRNNNISGIEWDGRGIHRVIEIRNNEQATHVRLNCDVSGNTIKGKSVHNIFFGYSETTAYNGLGNFVLKNNNIDFDEIRDVPFSFQEKNQSGVTGGLLEVSGNTITTRKNDAWVNILNLECETRPLIKFNGNTINMPMVTKQQIRLVSSAGASKQFLEVMNNIWNTASTADQVKALFITRNTVPASNINVYNNRVKDSNGDIITYDGATTNATSKDPANPSTQPSTPVGGNIWEDSYTLPTATVTAPDSSIVLNWDGATADSIQSSDGFSIVVQAGGYPPVGWTSIVDTAASPKYMRSRLKRDMASAGVYPRLKMNRATTSISTIIFPMKIVSLGTSSRITTGLPIIGFGKTENEVDSVISGGAVAIQGSDATKFKFTKTNGIYVDGKPYNLEELSIGKHTLSP